MYADGAMVAHLLRLAEPHITSRNVAGDKWDSCRAIDCVRRTDRLVLMCFVVPLHLLRSHSDIEVILQYGSTFPNDLDSTSRWILVLAILESWMSRGITRTEDFVVNVVPTAPGNLIFTRVARYLK